MDGQCSHLGLQRLEQSNVRITYPGTGVGQRCFRLLDFHPPSCPYGRGHFRQGQPRQNRLLKPSSAVSWAGQTSATTFFSTFYITRDRLFGVPYDASGLV